MSRILRFDDFSTQGKNITTQEKLGRKTRNKEYGAEILQFYSSSQEKHIGFNSEGEELLKEGFREAFRALGVSEGHRVVNWASPEGTPHMSGWCVRNATDFTEGTVNSSVADDFEDYMASAREANVAISTPKTFKLKGRQLQNEYGDLQELFPELELCIGSGDVITDSIREWVAEHYGVTLKGAYFGTEPGAVAVEDEPSVYRQTNPNLILEILEEGSEVGKNGEVSEEDVYLLEDLEEGESVTGSMLFNTPLREVTPLQRYRNGDVWTAWGVDDEYGFRMEFEGRDDNVILCSGANVTPKQLHDAMGIDGWKVVVSEEDDYVCTDFYLPDEYIPEEVPNEVLARELEKAIADQNKAFRDWRKDGAIGLQAQTFDPGNWQELEKELEEEYQLPVDDNGRLILFNDLRGKTPKGQRIAFDETYNASY